MGGPAGRNQSALTPQGSDPAGPGGWTAGNYVGPDCYWLWFCGVAGAGVSVVGVAGVSFVEPVFIGSATPSVKPAFRSKAGAAAS